VRAAARRHDAAAPVVHVYPFPKDAPPPFVDKGTSRRDKESGVDATWGATAHRLEGTKRTACRMSHGAEKTKPTQEKSKLAAGPAKLGAIFSMPGQEFSNLGKFLVQLTSIVHVLGKFFVVHNGNVVVFGKICTRLGEDPVVYGQEFSNPGTFRAKLGKVRVVPGKNLAMPG